MILKSALCVVSLSVACAVSIAEGDTTAPQMKPTARVESLVKQMTLEEKIGQVSQVFKFPKSMFAKLPPGTPSPFAAMDEMVRQGKLGSLILLNDTPEEANRLQHIAVDNSRLHIPLLFGADVIHGFDTIFPVPLAMAASWDPAMVQMAQSFAASEARAGGVNWTFGPMVDIARDPRWGRIVEGAGEDPFLGSAMARAQVRGFQGLQPISPGHVLATLKHFAGYGASEGGRDHDAANVSEAQLHNVILPPFLAGVQAGSGSVMSAYMDLNDVPASANSWLLHDLLRTEWGYRGFVVSDNNSVSDLVAHGFAKDEVDAAARGLKAGIDMAMGTIHSPYAKLVEAMAKGLITTQQIDAAVRHVLTAKMALGLFEHPYIDEPRAEQVQRDLPQHREAARLAAEESAVLLRNDGHLLPLTKSAYHHVAVIGPLGNSKQDILGPWVVARNTGEAVTVAEGLRAAMSPTAQVDFAPGVQIRRDPPSPFEMLALEKSPAAWDATRAHQEFDLALRLAQDSDLIVLVMGEKQDMIGESASRSSLDFPGAQQQLMESIVAIHKPTVLVLINARPLSIGWAAEHIPAILEMWYPGREGGVATANLLLGNAVPGGKLPVTWPRGSGQIPIYYAHSMTQDPDNESMRYWDSSSLPLFPFGFGLSYSTFAFTHAQPNVPQIKVGGSIDLSVEVENTGDMAAGEVAELYIHQRYGSASRPVRELKGFERVVLQPHEKRTVHFLVGKEELRYWSSQTRGWVNDASTIDFWIGTDSSASLHSTFEVVR
jgi:beta-glucosidase